MSNACNRQRSSWHLAVLVWSTTKVGGAVISRTSWEVNRHEWGVCERALKLHLSRKGLAGKAKAKTGIGKSDLPGLQGGPRKRDFVFRDQVRAPRLYPDGSGRQGCKSEKVRVFLPSIACFGRLAYPMHTSVTMCDLLGWKSHGCPAAFSAQR